MRICPATSRIGKRCSVPSGCDMRRYRDRKTEDLLLEQEDAPALPCGEWQKIPGYGGAYEINWDGHVRTWRWRGTQFSQKPRLLTAYMRKKGKQGRARYVKLTDEHGKAHEVKVLALMVDVWLGGPRPGKVPYHKNGDLNDSSVNNIAFATKKELGKIFGATSSRRKPVAKVTPDGEVIALYPSARKAAAANHMSYQTVLDRCNGKVKKPFALDGTTYVFDI